MRSRKLDNITSEQTDQVLSMATWVIGIGWAIIILAFAGALFTVIAALGTQDGNAVAASFYIGAASVIVWGSIGLILLLLGHSSRLNAYAVKGNLIDVGVGVPRPRGRFATSRFGATLVDRPEGVVVVDVDEMGSVDEAGVRPDDIIVALADVEPVNVTTISNFVRTTPPGTRVELTYSRGSDEVTVELTLG